jgi:hypothetical protein
MFTLILSRQTGEPQAKFAEDVLRVGSGGAFAGVGGNGDLPVGEALRSTLELGGEFAGTASQWGPAERVGA